MKQEKHIKRTVVGIELIRQLADQGKRIITLDDARSIAAQVGISESYLAEAFHHLEASGWIGRLRKGLYVIEQPMLGGAPLHEYEVAMHLVSPGAISHWSAMQFHGLTEQIPRTVFVLTSDPGAKQLRTASTDKHRRAYVVHGTSYVFVLVKPERYFGIQQDWIGEARINITDLERTLIDGLIRPAYCGGFGEVVEAFESNFERIDISKIIAYALRLDQTAARRLGWMLERSGASIKQLEQLQQAVGSGYRLLDPTGPLDGHCNKTWMLQENLRR